MPKKRNRSHSSGGMGKKKLSSLKSGGSAFRDYSIPVATKSRKLNNRPG